MLIKKFNDCPEVKVLDGCLLRELLSGLHDSVEARYSLAHAKLSAGEKSLPHALKTTEVYYILKGQGIMHIDKESREVEERDTVYIPPRAVQYIENSGSEELEFLCLVDPAWRLEDELNAS